MLKKQSSITSSKKRDAFYGALREIMLLLALLMIPLYGEAMSKSITSGIYLCVTTVIPSVFPFMILSSMLIGYSVFEQIRWLARPFTHVFKVNEHGLSTYLCGVLCGFPLGAKCAAQTYRMGFISKDECERLIVFSSGASPAFLICGVGSLRGDLTDGIILYLITVLSGALLGFLLGKGKSSTVSVLSCGKEQKFSITESVEHAGISTLYVCSYLLLFSALIGVLKLILSENEALLSLILPFLELGSAASFLAKARIPRMLSLALTAFCASFGGLSVCLQSLGFLKSTDVDKMRLMRLKLLHGVIAFLLACIACIFL